MKKILLIGCLCLVGFLSHTQADTIYAVVNADTAIIRHDSYHTNCASLFVMEFNELDYHINVYEIDTGDIAYCLCYFNLATKIGPLSAGNYTVDVYGKWRDYPNELEWFGSTFFTIEGNAPGSPLMLGNFQSDCYQNVGIKEFNSPDSEIAMMSVNPNPVNRNAEIVINIIKPDKYELKLLDETGKFVEVIFKMNIDKGIHHISWDSSCIASGLYFLQLSGTKAIISQKVIVQ